MRPIDDHVMGIDSCQVGQHTLVKIDHETCSTVILSLLLNQGQLSVSCKIICRSTGYPLLACHENCGEVN